MNQLAEVWTFALIVYVVGHTPSIRMILRHIEKEWNNVAKPQVFLHENGYFVVKFQNIDDRNEILYSGPHMFNNRPMIIKAWSHEFSFYDKMLRVIPLWVRLPNLPLSYWSMDSLSRIGSMIGVPLYADECTTHQKRISFEWAPLFCKKCQVVGHDCAKKGAGVKVGKGADPKPTQKWVVKPVAAQPVTELVTEDAPTVPIPLEQQVETEHGAGRDVEVVTEVREQANTDDTRENEATEIRPPWNIVIRGQKGKEIEHLKGPGVITHIVDEAGSSSFTLSPG